MLNNRSSKPLVEMEASFNNGQDAHTTPAVPSSNAIITFTFSFFFKKKMERKLMNNGLVAIDNAANSCCHLLHRYHITAQVDT